MRERAGDFDQLLLPDAELARGRGGIEVTQPDAGQRLPGPVMQVGKANEPGTPRQPAEEDILGDAQGRDDVEFLEDHDDAGVFGLAFGARRVRAAIELNLAAVGGS